MPINLDQHFLINERALSLRGQRSEILAGNIANMDTPGFKARDFDFKSVMQKQLSELNTRDKVDQFYRSNPSENQMNLGLDELKYRIAANPALDDNTVDPHMEKVEFAKNAFEYQAALEFFTSKIRGLETAIRGQV